MTVIVGYRDKDSAIIGADSQITAGNLRKFADKIVKRANWACGSCGYRKVIDIIRYNSTLGTDIKNTMDLCEWRDKLREAICRDAGSRKECQFNNDIMVHPFELLITFDGKMWKISGDYSLFEVKKYAAIGCGMDFAYGVLFSSPKTGVDLVKEAIRAAIKHDVYCGGPIKLATTKRT
jgi:20S proteasome alpha/beta subunit